MLCLLPARLAAGQAAQEPPPRFTLTFADADAWKFDNTASLTAALTSVFSLRVSNIVRYAHDPVPGFEQTDTITSVALVLTITRPGP